MTTITRVEPNKLKLSPLSRLFPEMPSDQYDALVDDIRAHGILQPVTILDGEVIDGRHRVAAAAKFGISVPTIEWCGRSTESPAEYVASLNLMRRHLTKSQAACIAVDLLPHLEAEAKKRQGARSDIVESIPQNSDASGRSRDRAAAALDVNPRYVSDAKTLKAESPELFEAVKNGDSDLRGAKRKQIQQRNTATVMRRVAHPDGRYDVIIIDPPWPMKKSELAKSPTEAGFDYPTMTEAEIAAIELPAADHCHLWLWTTHRFIPMALRLIAGWDFKYSCTFVWNKPGGFQPFNLPQFNCEFALYARRGDPQFVDTKAFSCGFEAQRAGHSVKPAEFYDIVRRVTTGRRLDMFNRRHIEGFDGWGNESPKQETAA